MEDVFNKFGISLFGLSFLLLRLPPAYMLPVKSGLVNTHSFARYVILALFFTLVLLIFKKKAKFKMEPVFAGLIAFYFLSQSISIIKAFNIEAFLLAYKTTLFGLLVLILAIFFTKKQKGVEIILKVLLVSIILNIIFEGIVYFQVEPFFSWLKQVLYDKYWEVFDLNLRRERFFVDILDASLVPLVFYFVLKTKKRASKIFGMILTALIAFFAVVSNFRTQVVMFTISLFGTLTLYLKRLSKFSIQAPIIVVFLFLAYFVSIGTVGYNAIDRLLSPNKEDFGTLTSRLNYWNQSVEMGISSPFFGVGLGNFYDILEGKKTIQLSLYDPEGKLTAITDSHPHNIFFGALAETGFVGLIALVALVIYFIKEDILVFKEKEKRPLAVSAVISFWSLFFYSVLNPPDTIQYMSLFWVLRVLVMKG